MSHLAGALQISSPRASTDDWFTPLCLWEPLDREFRFTVDVAGHDAAPVTNAIGRQFGNGLYASWKDESVWCNPPYSKIAPWVEKAHREMIGGCQLVVMLVPANKSEQPWWQTYVEPFRDGRGEHDAFTLETRFIAGRVKHGHPGDPDARKSGTFASVLLIWRHR